MRLLILAVLLSSTAISALADTKTTPSDTRLVDLRQRSYSEILGMRVTPERPVGFQDALRSPDVQVVYRPNFQEPVLPDSVQLFAGTGIPLSDFIKLVAESQGYEYSFVNISDDVLQSEVTLSDSKLNIPDALLAIESMFNVDVTVWGRQAGRYILVSSK